MFPIVWYPQSHSAIENRSFVVKICKCFKLQKELYEFRKIITPSPAKDEKRYTNNYLQVEQKFHYHKHRKNSKTERKNITRKRAQIATNSSVCFELTIKIRSNDVPATNSSTCTNDVNKR